MQNTSLFLSLIYCGKSSITCNICKHSFCQPFPSYAIDRQQAVAVNSFNSTDLNYLQLLSASSHACCLDCTLDLTGCDCFQITFICLLLSNALILTGSNWSQLLPTSCKSLHLPAVKLCTSFCWFRLFHLLAKTFQLATVACSSFSSGQQFILCEFSAHF